MPRFKKNNNCCKFHNTNEKMNYFIFLNQWNFFLIKKHVDANYDMFTNKFDEEVNSYIKANVVTINF
jgi:hypothetical protein